MTLSYLMRLLCLCLASFFLVHLAVGMALSLLTPAAIACAERMRPTRAARFLLSLRLLPWAFASLVVAGLCAPSYLLLEPAATGEWVGPACLVSALLCLASAAVSGARCVRAARRSLGYVRYCRMVGRQEQLSPESSPVWVVEGPAPFLVLAGIVRPRLLISRPVVHALTGEQLAAALRHEQGHLVSRDNFKRLLLLLAPDLFPGGRGFARLERAWNRFAEWSADDYAAAGDARRSLSLASALVSVARLGACPQAAPLITSLLADNRDLAARVERLLRDAPGAGSDDGPTLAAALATSAAAALLLLPLLHPGTLRSAHRLFEYLTAG